MYCFYVSTYKFIILNEAFLALQQECCAFNQLLKLASFYYNYALLKTSYLFASSIGLSNLLILSAWTAILS